MVENTEKVEEKNDLNVSNNDEMSKMNTLIPLKQRQNLRGTLSDLLEKQKQSSMSRDGNGGFRGDGSASGGN